MDSRFLVHISAFFLAAARATASESATPSYEKYVMAQRSKTDRLSANGVARDQWVDRPQLAVVAEYVQKHLQLVTKFALCHGARSGREAVWFRELLPAEQVWGTELSPIAARHAPWTMQGDFHDERPEWVGAADFVYTNALDHSFNSSLAITRWMRQVHANGATFIQWSNYHETNEPRSPFGRHFRSETPRDGAVNLQPAGSLQPLHSAAPHRGYIYRTQE